MRNIRKSFNIKIKFRGGLLIGMIFVVLSVIIVQLLLVVLTYRFYKTFVHPSIVFGIYFSVQVLLGILIFKENNYSYYGLIWIIIATIFFELGGIFSKTIFRKFDKLLNCEKKICIKISLIILITSTMIAIVTFGVSFIKKGVVINSLRNVQYWLEVNNKFAIERYSRTSINKNSILEIIMLVFTYFSPLIGGFNFNFYSKKIMKLVSVFSLIPSFCIVAIQNTKSSWIAGCILFLSGYITSSILIRGGLKKISVKKCVYTILAIVTFIGINYVAMIARSGKFSFEIIKVVNKKIIVYALGHIPTFDGWFLKNALKSEYTFGLKTFYGISDFLGIEKKIQGIYSEFVTWTAGKSNIYTMFRPFIEDYGIILGLIIFFILGVVFDIIFRKIKNKTASSIEIVIMSSGYFYILYGFITSVWAYMSFIAVFILFIIYIYIVLERTRER